MFQILILVIQWRLRLLKMSVCVCVCERGGERRRQKYRKREKRQGERRGRGRGGEEEERRFPNPLWGVALWPLQAWRQSQAQKTNSLCKWNLDNKHYSFFFFKNLITLPLLLYSFRLLVSKSFSFLFLETLFSESLVFLKKYKKQKKFFF